MESSQTDQKPSLSDLKRQLEEAYEEYLSLPIGRYQASFMKVIIKLEDDIEELEGLL